MSKKGSHEKFTTDTDTDQESLSLPSSTFRGNTEAGGSLSSSLKNFERSSKAVKKVKRVQFQDGRRNECELLNKFGALLIPSCYSRTTTRSRSITAASSWTPK